MTSTTHTPPAVTSRAARPRSTWARGYLDRLTYTRTLHLVSDLALGIVYFTCLVVLLSTSAALLPTLLGVPLLMGTLLAGRAIGHLERTRARVLLGVDIPAPGPHPRGFWRRLLDGADWRSTLYGVLLLPVSVGTGGVALTAWSTMGAAIAHPVYAPAINDPGWQFGDHQVTGVPADLIALAVGAAVLLVLPRLMHLLARIDDALVRALLR